MADNDMLSDLEFENEMNALGDDQLGLIKFVARQQYDAGKVIAEHGKRIRRLEKQNKKAFGFVGLISAGIVAALNYFLGRGS